MKAGLRSLLLSWPTVTDLVGPTGVYINDARQGQALPYIVIEQTDADSNNTLDSPTGGFRTMEYEIRAKGRTAGEADALEETVRDLLKDYTGPAGSQVIEAVIVDEEYDDVERPVDGSDQKTFVVVLVLTLQYRRA